MAQKYSPVFKKTAVNSERVTHESYIKLISWVALYMSTQATQGTLIVPAWPFAVFFTVTMATLCSSNSRSSILYRQGMLHAR